MRRARGIVSAVALVLVTTGGVLAGVERGNRLFRAGEYAEAVAEYRAALESGEDSPVLRYNLGTALLQLGRYDEAEEQLLAALDAVDPQLRQWVLYNLGQRFLEDARSSDADPRAAAELYDAAVEAYRQALRLRPDDRDAKWNYELALQEREEQQQQQSGEGEPEQEGDQGQEGDEGRAGDEGEEDSTSPRQDDSEEQQPSQPRPGEGQQPLTPEQAARILSGVEQDERELFRDKLRQGQQQTRAVRDW